ncbi:aminotransferase DegT [Gordoniibacillus kamchatkensis]|uniref:Aminotransferase DegT n=1 Tax=Gordoniibacillus kamchatkensis TaxID=1590651 RepID=A0ABR5AKP8_9BACL|nr:aminotransferase class I/II-fold pyridoxal phosphate-dependent enzyme [Paenibacillus sp. VKM B-2647]KIL41611.1 aminotransferase DegT [Paenibacillus sp. VKM B-2647]
MDNFPFLVPNLVKKESFQHLFSQIESSRRYSNYGPLNSLFEEKVVNEMFDHVGSAVTVNNATSGLMLAISQCKRPKARYALMPSFTFAATPLAALWCGLEPYFVDITEDTWCMNERMVDDLLEKLGEEVAVVVPYATFGTDMDLTYYQKLQDAGVPVVVDAAASFGSTGDDGHFGKGFSGLIVFSFHATKAFGIGEGGLVYSGNGQAIGQIRQAGNFGFSGARESSILGLNSKISEYTAAIALATLDVFQEKTSVRQTLYKWYVKYLTGLGLPEKGWIFHNCRGIVPHQFFPVLCPEEEMNRDIVAACANRQVELRTYFSPACHQQKLFASCPSTSLQVTDNVSKRILSLPLWEEMTEHDVKTIAERLAER